MTWLQNKRFRDILFFFGQLIAQLLLWDLLCGKLPWLGRQIRKTRPRRLREWAGRFRHLAVNMGGVMIKLGQFFSTRVDVFPPEITEELQGLQDEVPPVSSHEIFTVLEAELGALGSRFATIEHIPVAAASLGQVHRARLHGPAAEEAGAVVIKIQRPGIHQLVKIDLAAIGVVGRWVMLYPPVRKRADVPALLDEFARTLWEELDYEAEADNAERFATIFRDNPTVYIPAVYRQHSTNKVLVLEDVEHIKIGDHTRLTESGITLSEVAEKLFELYIYQVFEAGFFHADPHPGNIFIEPRPDITWQPEDGPRPFRLIFVDFGMVGRIPDDIGGFLRQAFIGLSRRDTSQIIKAVSELGFFLPGADLDRIAEVVDSMLGRIWGRSLLELARPDPQEMMEIGKEFRDILFQFPFQVPQDFIYLGRAMGMLSGMISSLNPEINPWQLLEKHGRQLLKSQQWEEFDLESIWAWIRPYLTVPTRLENLLAAIESGQLQIQTQFDDETMRILKTTESGFRHLSWSIVAAAGLLSATALYLYNKSTRNDPRKE